MLSLSYKPYTHCCVIQKAHRIKVNKIRLCSTSVQPSSYSYKLVSQWNADVFIQATSSCQAILQFGVCKSD